MNNSKKLKTKKIKKDHLIEQKPITKISKPWIIVSAVLLVILIGSLLFDQFYERTIMTIDGKDYKMSDVAYYFYSVESKYSYYDQMFGGGGAYWDMVPDETTGVTVRDMAKEEAVKSVLYNEILYKEAVAAGYTLTEDEKTTVSKNVDSLLKEQMPSSVKTKNNFTKKSLTDVISKETLVSRYRQDKIDKFEIDDAGITAGISKEEYRQYDIEYLFASTKTTDADNKTVAMTEEEKKAAYDKISSYYETAKTTADWSKLIPEGDTTVTYKASNFVKNSGTFSADMETMMMAMNNGDISDIYEAEDGYYIVRMVNNDSPESYDNAVKSAISDAENKAFTEYYTEIEAKHKYTTNKKALNSMTMGSVTLVQ